MKSYHVVVTDDAKADLKRYIDYLLYSKKSTQAAESVVLDFVATRQQLTVSAGSLGQPDSEELKKRSLRRINLIKHDYFLLYKIIDDKVFITNMFHAREDYEKKL